MSTTSSAGAAVNATAATDAELQPAIAKMMPSNKSAVLHRSLKAAPPQVVSANGKYLTFSNGQTILDTTCGAAVACIGSNNERVKKAMIAQLDKFAYCNSMFFGHPIGEELADELIRGTDDLMSKAYIMCSGSEAMDAAMKMARQYFVEIGQPQRVKFIARENSYHGTTLGSLSMGGHVARRSLFTDMLLPNIGRVSPCNAYRGMTEGQTVEQYVEQLADELDHKFQEVGPETVCAFVAEPVVGAIEFVSDKATKEPFLRSYDIANKVHMNGLNEFGISLYPGNGTKDGTLGDHVLLAPAYTSTAAEIEEIAARTKDSILRTFQDL
ncbi:hypothetical protein COL922a_012699 [Colletotrichum nupharicola]|nr:hypothetical protein COL922a_012699 [Colletotrichum nupharicola]